MKKILFLYLLLLQFVSFGQEAEYYRFSYDYFVSEVKSESENRKYYLKTDKGWKEVFSKSIDEKKINENIDWKIEETGKMDKGAFSEGGVYSLNDDSDYEALKENWKYKYYKPIWEIRIRELKLDIKYDTSTIVKTGTGDKVFDVTERSAEFVTGQMNLFRYFTKSISIPEGLSPVATKLFVQFVVYKNGKIGEVEIIRGVDPRIDNEVLRVLKGMPNWIPARQKGKCVASRMILPIKLEFN